MPPPFTGSSNTGNEECPYFAGFLWRQGYLTDVTYPHLVGVTDINLLTVLPTILLNSLVIVTVATRHRLQPKSHVLVAELADVDLLNGLVNQDMAGIFSDGPFCSLKKASCQEVSFFLWATLC